MPNRDTKQCCNICYYAPQTKGENMVKCVFIIIR